MGLLLGRQSSCKKKIDPCQAESQHYAEEAFNSLQAPSGKLWYPKRTWSGVCLGGHLLEPAQEWASAFSTISPKPIKSQTLIPLCLEYSTSNLNVPRLYIQRKEAGDSPVSVCRNAHHIDTSSSRLFCNSLFSWLRTEMV
jgi:hypothetical protein